MRTIVIPVLAALLAAIPAGRLLAEDSALSSDAVRKHAGNAFKDLDAEGKDPETEPAAAPEAPPAPAPSKAAPPPAEPKPAIKPAPAPAPEPVTWDFETGDLRGWSKLGAAFDAQPTYGDNPTARGRGQASQHRGDYWIGTYEKRHGPSDPPGAVQGDGPMGTLSSHPFTITSPTIGFLIGGGCDLAAERVSLLIDGKPVLQATGKCSEAMEPVVWDVGPYLGKTARIEAVDASEGGWGHINLDDIVFGPAKDDSVDCGGGNLALRKPALMSSTGFGGAPEGGVDGVKNGGYAVHSSCGDAAWWQVDLGKNCRLGRIAVYNRQNYEARANSLAILTTRDEKPTETTKWKKLASYKDAAPFGRDSSGGPVPFGGVYNGKPWSFEPKSESARWVRLQLSAANCMNLDEIEVFGPASLSE